MDALEVPPIATYTTSGELSLFDLSEPRKPGDATLLLQLQKPGLRFAASAFDWRERFGRAIKDGARPLLILWPLGPVATVYDVQDTEGKELPDDVNCFVARGEVDLAMFHGFKKRLTTKRIRCEEFDGGDGNAGSICVVQYGVSDKEPTIYRMLLNRNHAVSVRFVTLAHELGHLFLGHLGADTRRFPYPAASRSRTPTRNSKLNRLPTLWPRGTALSRSRRDTLQAS